MFRTIYWFVFVLSCAPIIFFQHCYFYLITIHKKNFLKKAEETSHFWLQLFFRQSGSEIIIEGEENYDPKKSYIVVSNHQSIFDIMVMSFLKLSFLFISREFYFKIPFLGWSMKNAGHISIDNNKPRKAIKSIKKAAQKLAKGHSIVIFPEGTRSFDGRISSFKTGALKIAYYLEEFNILPVCLYGTREICKKNSILISSFKKTRMIINKPIACKNSQLKTPESKKKLLEKIEKVVKSNYKRCFEEDNIE